MERWGSRKLTELQYTTAQTLARVMSLDVHITMRWIPSHKEEDFPNDWRITGNAKVDTLATQAMLNPVPDMKLPFSTTHVRQLAKKTQKPKKNKGKTSTTRPNHLQISQEDKKLLRRIPREFSSSIWRIICNHHRLGGRWHRLRLKADPSAAILEEHLCQFCNQDGWPGGSECFFNLEVTP